MKRTRARVEQRLTQESDRLAGEAAAARAKEQAGIKPKESSDSLFRKAHELQARRTARLAMLDQQAQLATKPPRIVTAALVLPPFMVEPGNPSRGHIRTDGEMAR